MTTVRARASVLLPWFLFWIAGLAGAQQELLEISPDELGPDDWFGSVAIGDGRLLVGCYNDDDLGPEAGAVYVFDAVSGQQLFKLYASGGAPFDRFGSSVDLSGSRAIVGAPHVSDQGGSSGAAYVFDLDSGQELFKLSSSDLAADDRFGVSVSIHGDRAVVGAHFDDDHGMNSGSAYVFDVGTGQELRKLTSSGAAPAEFFGFRCSVSGDRAAITALGEGDGSGLSGTVYVFDVESGQELFELDASEPSADDWFGYDVAITSERVVVGAPYHDFAGADSGTAYVFDLATGQLLSQLNPSDASSKDWFSTQIGVSGDRVLLGAYGNDDDGDRSGAAYVFDLNTGNELYKLTASNAMPQDYFGIDVAIEGEAGIVAAPGDDGQGSKAGAVYVIQVPQEGVAYCFGDGSGRPCACGNTGAGGEGCANSTGEGGLLTASGSAGVALDDLVLQGFHLLPSEPAIAFVGSEALAGGGGISFGDGLRCAGNSVVRLGIASPSADGTATWGPGLGAIAGWLPGERRYLQVLYVDGAGPCGSRINLTNGIEIELTP